MWERFIPEERQQSQYKQTYMSAFFTTDEFITNSTAEQFDPIVRHLRMKMQTYNKIKILSLPDKAYVKNTSVLSDPINSNNYAVIKASLKGKIPSQKSSYEQLFNLLFRLDE